MTYTTAQLIQFLDQELRANWKGERVLLSPAQRINNPAIAKALDPDKLSKVFAYRDFRAQIHAYQREHKVSGIVWRTCRFDGRELHLPELHNHLVAIEGDKEILMAAKSSVIDFWQGLTTAMQFWLPGEFPLAIASSDVRDRIDRAEWAILDAARTELYLGLCWGKPEECHCDWARPESGCDRVIAAVNEPSSVKV
ncbi:hypothetical protein [Synechococcus sp. PCC 7336]|uniref:hypothetical protein n=1 Tax=Synechococcus sp. PCC 7336 TaxID=195250 RepID=UPI0003498639|nr:hypothetical protein [Synechococcus sp. PCC 7336]